MTEASRAKRIGAVLVVLALTWAVPAAAEARNLRTFSDSDDEITSFGIDAIQAWQADGFQYLRIYTTGDWQTRDLGYHSSATKTLQMKMSSLDDPRDFRCGNHRNPGTRGTYVVDLYFETLFGINKLSADLWVCGIRYFNNNLKYVKRDGDHVTVRFRPKLIDKASRLYLGAFSSDDEADETTCPGEYESSFNSCWDRAGYDLSMEYHRV